MDTCPVCDEPVDVVHTGGDRYTAEVTTICPVDGEQTRRFDTPLLDAAIEREMEARC